MAKLNYLNLGCGYHFHKDWINIDFISTGEGVIAHNLTQGIPLESESVKVVYHSHVLEHFSKSQGEAFIQECYRVLMPNGIIRIAIPDLLGIINEYINIIKKLDKNPNDLQVWADYDWIMLEMYDQTVRNKSGGYMADFLYQDEIINWEFVKKRIGFEGENIRNAYLQRRNNKIELQAQIQDAKKSISWKYVLKKPFRLAKRFLKHFLFKEEIMFYNKQTAFYNEQKQYAEIGKFRLSGEIHQWMYDKYALTRLLKKCGFENIKVQTYTESFIPNWVTFGIEAVEGKLRKPDSLFMEATKPKL
jgi:predicted SAM-dependent methyltransferase